MRVHELDEHYGVSKDEVKAALAELGASTNHLSKPSDEVLAQLEERFARSNVEREHPGTGEEMEPDDSFDLVNFQGQVYAQELLPPDLAELVRSALGPRQKIADATLNLDRGEFCFVTYPDAQKVRIPYGK